MSADSLLPRKKTSHTTRLLLAVKFFYKLISLSVLAGALYFFWQEVSVMGLNYNLPTQVYAFKEVTKNPPDDPSLPPLNKNEAIRYAVTTWDDRILTVDLLLGHAAINALAPQPLTIVICPSVQPTFLRSYMETRGGNILVVYQSPRWQSITAPDWPVKENGFYQLGDVWAYLTTNPVVKNFERHLALHEAPIDVAEIARWAIKEFYSEKGRVNLIGVGTGAMVAADAALLLSQMGIPPSSLVMVYPPADFDFVVETHLTDVPGMIRTPLAKLVAWTYRRLEFSRSLPYLTSIQKLIVVPGETYELPEAAYHELLQRAQPRTKIMQINYNYTQLAAPSNITYTRNVIADWLLSINAIN